jgi:hypothetical protein
MYFKVKAKREEFWSMLEYTDPDNIIASETWLKPEIKESEVLPDSYHFVARKDRPGSGQDFLFFKPTSMLLLLKSHKLVSFLLQLINYLTCSTMFLVPNIDQS